ncbi:MAG TPA: DJ-1 family protein [Candidatus Omnitrophica bacterium]|nr:DJ-1 family protein [Candidatus Omnitrophota bacterium]
MPKKAIVILAEGFEETEAVTVIDILRRSKINVTVAGLSGTTVRGSHNIAIITDKKLDGTEQDHDCLILPGGMPGAGNLIASKKVRSIITAMYQKGRVIAAICAAPSVVLAPCGVLKGKAATGYPGMEKGFGKETRREKKRVVVDGNIITSQGPSTAMQFALAIAEKLAGKQTAQKVKKAVLA